MNVEIGTEAAQFPEKEYINEIFLAVCSIQDVRNGSARRRRVMLCTQIRRECRVSDSESCI
jgi:hypothetical protein